MKRTNIILIALLVALAAAGIAGYVAWNKPHPKVEDRQADVVSAQTLYTAFTANEAAANQSYLNKVLQITGKVTEVSRNQDGRTVAVLGTDDPLGGIQCTFRDAATVTAGQTITVKGFCNGYTIVVLLNDCVLAGQQ